MIRLMGAVMVMAGTVGLGWKAVGRLEERAKALRGLQGAAAYLEEELTFRLTPLPKLLTHLAQSREGAVGVFFSRVSRNMTEPEAPFKQRWRQAAEDTLTMLREDERQAVAELGEVLGQYDAQTQAQALKLAGERLAGYYLEAQSERQRLGKVYLALSVAGGLATVLVLI